MTALNRLCGGASKPLNLFGDFMKAIIAAVGFAVVAAFITFIRFKKFFLPHTVISKLLGGMVFGLPIVVQVIPVLTWMTIIGVVATISVIEILLMQTLCLEAEDELSIFHTMKNRKANKK